MENDLRFGTMKFPCVPSLSQAPYAWDTKLVSDVRGRLNEPGKQGRREKREINLVHARIEEPPNCKSCKR